MARLFTCGFEENNFTATMWSAVDSEMSLVTAPVRSGTYAARSFPSAASGGVRRDLSSSVTSGTYFFRYYFRLAALPAATEQTFVCSNSVPTSVVSVELLTTGILRLRNIVAGTSADSTTALVAGAWYRIEVRYLISDTGGELELRINGVTEASLTAQDTLGTNFQRFTFGNGVLGTHDFFYDDIAVNDAAGTFQTSWPGPGKIALAKADGNVSVTWEGLGGTSNWDRIDDLPGAPDDNATYNLSPSTAASVDRLSLGTLPAEIPSDADMILLDMYMRVGGTGTTARNITNKIWDEGGVLTNGPLISAATTAWRFPSIGPTDEHQVFNLGARTKANVEAFDVGYDNTASQPTRERRVTALWVNVEWIEAAGVTITPSGIASLEAFGTAREILTLFGTGLASLEAFGSTRQVFQFSPAGIASLEAFGTAKETLRILGIGLASEEAFGTVVILGPITVSPTGIASAEVFGTARQVFILSPTGLVSGEAFGNARQGFTLVPTGVASLEAFGAARQVLVLLGTGIASVEAFGTAKEILTVRGTGLASGEIFGASRLAFILSPTGIASLEAFGTARQVFLVLPSGLASGEFFGLTVVTGGAPLVVGRRSPWPMVLRRRRLLETEEEP